MTASGKAQSFEYIYSTTDDEQVSDAAEDTAGNYYIVGFKGSDYFLWTTNISIIIKLNPNGDTVKTVILPHPPNSISELRHVIGITDTTFAAIGIISDTGSTIFQIWYVKFDTDLNILDQKKIGDPLKTTFASHIRKSRKKEILITGSSHLNFSSIDIVMYRLSLDGDSLQSFLVGDTIHNEEGYDILDLADSSGYLIFAFTGYNLSNPTQLIRTNTNGVIDTIYDLSNGSGAESTSAVWLSDSTFAIEKSDEHGTGLIKGLNFTKFDLNFNIYSDTVIGPIFTNDKPAFKGMDMVLPGSIYGAGTLNWVGFIFEPLTSYFHAIKFNNDMQVQWEKIISHGDDFLNMWGVKATSDGGVLLLGTRYNYLTSGQNERDIYVVKLDSLGNLTTGINETSPVQVHDAVVYPSPAHDIININSTINFNATKITLYDTEGRKVANKKFDKSTSFSVSRLNSGIYFYEIKDSKGNERRGKIIKE